jgi:hypothetical protein
VAGSLHTVRFLGDRHWTNWITSIGGSGTAVDYENGASGLIERNTIIPAGGTTTGILLDDFFGGVTANDNTIIGANVGINLLSSESPTIVTHNQLYNSGTGILVTQMDGSAVIKSNSIVLSSIAAINFSICNNGNANTVEHNIIVDAPVGIENISPGDIVSGNPIYNVTSATTPCTDWRPWQSESCRPPYLLNGEVRHGTGDPLAFRLLELLRILSKKDPFVNSGTRAAASRWMKHGPGFGEHQWFDLSGS